ncbi:MAG: hypothetical protein FRX48_02356 [Lasallia pustulata]|uniref:Response regulatory domain-containing protein n=1 Tax=Lasallia pustulata TaxID=136370 RepID=A0A5M8PY31_9LECA|nr:MAG: hypothetical protein FRX48_02356 [Lasallia pustulata]
MGDHIKARILPLFRRSSTNSSAKSSIPSTTSSAVSSAADKRNRSKTSLVASRGRGLSVGGTVHEEDEREHPLPLLPPTTPATESQLDDLQSTLETTLKATQPTPPDKSTPKVTLEEPTPEPSRRPSGLVRGVAGLPGETQTSREVAGEDSTGDIAQRPVGPVRHQSLAHSDQTRFIRTLLESEKPRPRSQGEGSDYFGPSTLSANMLHRKIWVRRPGASATLVSINEEDLVDDVRDMVLKKYANSLGRSFDAPDVTLRIVPRDHARRNSQGERTLGPEEPITKTLDTYYPGGQTVDEALIIDVPQRRTPRHSPRVPMNYVVTEDLRPLEGGTDYFPPMPPQGTASPHLPSGLASASGVGPHHPSLQHSISVLSTGQLPPLPSPGSRGTRMSSHRPKYGRTQTSSPTIMGSTPHPQTLESMKSHVNGAPVPPPLPTPPIPSDGTREKTPPPPRASSPRLKPNKKPKPQLQLPAGLLEGAVPPINVLIVEDNIINLKLLEAFMKRLKVRWHTAMNGREAVTKWRQGGFHLVLMDIQLPVMNGLEATKEIRRLERLNNIGVFSSHAASAPALVAEGEAGGPEGDDRLMNTELFKSPVIIVALTASSLQSDRHEALAAGCNDFLTKPVNFVWLERKVMEWGCMQALIDFDGWRKWKDFSSLQASNSKDSSANKNAGAGAKGAGGKLAIPGPGKREKRGSVNTVAGEGVEGKTIAAGA